MLENEAYLKKVARKKDGYSARDSTVYRKRVVEVLRKQLQARSKEENIGP